MRRTTSAALRLVHPPTGTWIARQQDGHAQPQVRLSDVPMARFAACSLKRHQGPPLPAVNLPDTRPTWQARNRTRACQERGTPARLGTLVGPQYRLIGCRGQLAGQTGGRSPLRPAKRARIRLLIVDGAFDDFLELLDQIDNRDRDGEATENSISPTGRYASEAKAWLPPRARHSASPGAEFHAQLVTDKPDCL